MLPMGVPEAGNKTSTIGLTDEADVKMTAFALFVVCHSGYIFSSKDRTSLLVVQCIIVSTTSARSHSNNPQRHQKSIAMSGNDNPGNFANRSEEDVKNVASKGGQTGTENSGFANMPKEKVVSLPEPYWDELCQGDVGG